MVGLLSTQRPSITAGTGTSSDLLWKMPWISWLLQDPWGYCLLLTALRLRNLILSSAGFFFDHWAITVTNEKCSTIPIQIIVFIFIWLLFVSISSNSCMLCRRQQWVRLGQVCIQRVDIIALILHTCRRKQWIHLDLIDSQIILQSSQLIGRSSDSIKNATQTALRFLSPFDKGGEGVFFERCPTLLFGATAAVVISAHVAASFELLLLATTLIPSNPPTPGILFLDF